MPRVRSTFLNESEISLAPGFSRMTRRQRNTNRFSGFSETRKALGWTVSPTHFVRLKPGANETGFEAVKTPGFTRNPAENEKPLAPHAATRSNSRVDGLMVELADTLL